MVVTDTSCISLKRESTKILILYKLQYTKRVLAIMWYTIKTLQVVQDLIAVVLM